MNKFAAPLALTVITALIFLFVESGFAQTISLVSNNTNASAATTTNQSGATDSLLASQVTWKEHFGFPTSHSNTLFSLMAHGYFRSETTNVQETVERWMKNHPNAHVISVSVSGPFLKAQPSSRFAYVWVLDGKDNLNVELVRRGCVSPETQMLNPDQKPEVSTKSYDSFIQQITKAGEEAKKEKLGIFSHAQPYS